MTCDTKIVSHVVNTLLCFRLCLFFTRRLYKIQTLLSFHGNINMNNTLYIIKIYKSKFFINNDHCALTSAYFFKTYVISLVILTLVERLKSLKNTGIIKEGTLIMLRKFYLTIPCTLNQF